MAQVVQHGGPLDAGRRCRAGYLAGLNPAVQGFLSVPESRLHRRSRKFHRNWYNICADRPRARVRPVRADGIVYEGHDMRVIFTTAFLLCCSNIFMTFAWYGHLKNLAHRPWVLAALVSWGIAFFEYMIQVPANRIGHEVLNVGQLKILQEVVTLAVFVPFSFLYLKEHLRLDYLWAGLCILGAVFFIFRQKLFGG